MFGRGRRTEDHPILDPQDVLVGLAPSLVEDLAQLVGSTEDDLLVSFQVMPYGDRATLAAYRMIELDRSEGGRRRVTRVSPQAVELVNLASELLTAEGAGLFESFDTEVDSSDAVDNRRRPRTRLLASAAVPRVQVVDDVIGMPGPSVQGVVVATTEDRVLVRVPVLSVSRSQLSEESPNDAIEISPNHAIGGPGTVVALNYDSADVPLSQPRVLAVEELAEV